MAESVITPQQKFVALDGNGVFTNQWFRFFAAITSAIAELRKGLAGAPVNSGIPAGKVTLAKLTTGGTAGSITWLAGGTISAFTPPT